MRRGIDFRLKGERPYVHGTDMVEAAMREALADDPPAGPVRNLVFVINRVTVRNLELILDEVEPAGAAAVARFSFEARGAARRGILVERAGQPADRRSYDEAGLRSRCQTDAAARSIALRGASPLSPVETLVAMTKALHLAVYPQKPGQWLFARLEAPRWPLEDAGEGLEVQLGGGIGTRLTKSAARRGGELLAWIYFSLKEPA